MKPRHKKLAIIASSVTALGVASVLVLNAFQSNLVFFFSPTQVADNEAPVGRSFRIGGLVEEGSVKRQTDGVTVNFVVTDTAKSSRWYIRAFFPTCSRKAKAWWLRENSPPMAFSAQTRCLQSTTRITCRLKPPRALTSGQGT